ncbi:MAG TPA: sigma-70 family RNA polymerase sigma factor [Polyangiaceae bacterium]|jgi:RNA polymerase sigma-70 factor (ECF subfamily)|nr:sigma-70 family RNA polymerase sigma factor [Polyangiaceae bacterium]
MELPAANARVVFRDRWGAPPAGERELGPRRPAGRASTVAKISTPHPRFVDEVLLHVDALHHFARYLTRDAAVAEDLVQETFARCLSAHARFVPGTNSRAWLFRILRNAFIDGCRRLRNNPSRGGLDATEASDDDLRDTEPLRGDVEMNRLRGLVAEDIDAALGELSADARLVVLMDLEGFTETEMASVVGCAPGTVKSRLSRARSVLRARLKDYAR